MTGIDLTVDVGEFVAVVGHNGSGKSTLTRLLAGLPPSSGTVERP
ncbi:ATP-binding cassette domain-containing protein, partial [Nocardia cyriacigeorgica]